MKQFFLFFCTLLFAISSFAQNRNVNQDENKVPVFFLPEALRSSTGEKIASADQWEKIRRPQLISLFASQVYGVPFALTRSEIGIKSETVSENPNALNGKATCRQVKLILSRNNLVREIFLLIYLPKTPRENIPVFLGYNFNGNHTVHADPEIIISPSLAKVSTRDQTQLRGSQSTRWSIERIVNEGFAVITACYHDVYPDNKDLKNESILPLFDDFDARKTDPQAEQAIGAWARGLSLIMDYIASEKIFDAKRVALMGHSRQGKAALWGAHWIHDLPL